jgi:guanylate kinase
LNKNKENVKILEIFDYVKNNQYWTPTKKIMKNLLNGNSTELQVIDIEYDQVIKDESFSEKYLRRL